MIEPAELVAERAISHHVFDPNNAIFKEGRKERASSTTIWCKLKSCPLLDAGTCMLKPLMLWTRCPYGRVTGLTGPTRRAGKFRSWIREQKEKHPECKSVGYPATRIAFVGDYVYLPYSFMTMNERVPFLGHAHLLGSGNCLLPREHWTLDNVLKILAFRPQAMFGGEITDYQKKEVPLFLLHLRETDSVMWKELIAARPALDTTPNHVGRKALLRTLNTPITWTTKGNNCPVTWIWDGKEVSTTSSHAYEKVWGQIALDAIALFATPKDDTAIVVQDNAWVNERTVFVD
jgi:hypothetical protein